MIYHRSMYGTEARLFLADLHGYVATTPGEALTLAWPEPLWPEEAREIAAYNACAEALADSRIAAWRAAEGER